MVLSSTASTAPTASTASTASTPSTTTHTPSTPLTTTPSSSTASTQSTSTLTSSTQPDTTTPNGDIDISSCESDFCQGRPDGNYGPCCAKKYCYCIGGSGYFGYCDADGDGFCGSAG